MQNNATGLSYFSRLLLRRRWKLQVVSVVAAGSLACSAGTSSQAVTPVNKTLETAPVPGGSIQLVAQRCDSGGCKMVLKLISTKGVGSTIDLPWDASSATFTRESVNGTWGAVDSLAPDDIDVAWMSGDEERYLSTSMRLVSMPNKAVGVVVDQRGGFEHIVHAHVFAVVQKGTLVEAKRWVGSGGPFWSAVAVNSGEVLFQETYFSPEPSEPDEATIVAYAWDAKRSLLAEQKRKSPLWAVVVESYPSVVIARGLYESAGETNLAGASCLSNLSVLATSGVAGTGTSKAFIGTISTSESYAKSKAATVTKCAKRWKNVKVQKVS
jgi:hypothetical protein